MEADGSLVTPVRPIMLRDLMTHMSGLTYHFVDDSPVGKMYRRAKLLDAQCPLEAAIDDLARFPLAFQPGSRWRYSVGIDVAARVIEVISGRPLGAFLRERLFEPLGMVDTAFGVPPEKRDRLAAMYGRPGRARAGVTMSSELEAWARASTTASTCRSLTRSIRPMCSCAAGTACSARSAIIFASPRCWQTAESLTATRILGRKTLALMHANHVPAALLPLDIGGLPLPGYGFGLGSRVRSTSRNPPRRARSASSAGPARRRPTTGSIRRRAGRPLHDPVDDELRPAGARSARPRLSGD